MKLKEVALSIAKSEIGNGETGENNAGPHVGKYLEGLAEPPANWCAAFICWCFKESIWDRNITPDQRDALLHSYFTPTASARMLFNQFKFSDLGNPIRKEMIELKPTETELEPGDLIFFWRESENSWMGHVGIIEKINGNHIHTIEGNKGKFPSQVARYYYPRNYIPQLLGYGRFEI